MSPAELRVLRPDTGPMVPPPDRGRMLTAEQVAAGVFSGTVSAAWVRRKVPGKLTLGHSTVVWYEYDVRAWLEAQRASGPGDSVL